MAPIFAVINRQPCALQRGQGTVEFLLAAVPVLVLALSSIEAVHWYFARQAVSLALSQAARAAITQHADPVVLDQAFTNALLPFYVAPSAAVTRARLQRAMERRTHATDLPAWQIRILSPSTATFQDFAASRPGLPGDGRPVIDNDYLAEQHQARLAEGLHEGRGLQSGQTTLEANTLELDLTWLHEPLLPVTRVLLKGLAPADTRFGSLAMARGGYLPLRRQMAMVMQSHAVAWAMPAHGRVVRAHAAQAEEPAFFTRTHRPAIRVTTPPTAKRNRTFRTRQLPIPCLWSQRTVPAAATEHPEAGARRSRPSVPDPFQSAPFPRSRRFPRLNPAPRQPTRCYEP